MVAFLYSTLLNLVILDLAILVFPFKLTHTCQDWFPHLHKKNFTHSLWPNLKMEAILNSAILNFAILHSAILVFPLKLNHTCQDWFPPFAQKKLTHLLCPNLMMEAILNSVMLD